MFAWNWGNGSGAGDIFQIGQNALGRIINMIRPITQQN